jgi:hypothetical protein
VLVLLNGANEKHVWAWTIGKVADWLF